MNRVFIFIITPIVLLLLLTLNNNLLAQGNIISTFAGDSTAGYAGDGGSATAAELYYPHGLWIDSSGNTFIADQQNNAIRKVDALGIITTIAGTGTAGFSGDGGISTSAQIDHPYAVICDPAGNIYFSDYNNNRIRKVSTSGIITTVAGNGSPETSGDGGPATTAALFSPCGLAIDTAGNIYFGQELSGIVRKISASGIISTYAGTGGLGSDGDGGPATAATFDNPNYVHADGAGNLYVSDNGNNRVRKINSSGIISAFAGNGSQSFAGDGGPATDAQMGFPAGINIDAYGNVYISDSYNNCIRKVDSAGIISTFAGTGSATYNGDGEPATTANLTANDIAFDACGNLYDADYYNSRVRKIGSCSPTLTPIITKASEPEITIYPNPATNDITFNVNNLTHNQVSIMCYSIIGALVFEKEEAVANGSMTCTLDLNSLRSGIYEFVLQDEDGVRFVKSVVKN